jgi:hypothetical protein
VPNTGSGYYFPHHNDDCPQKRFLELFKEVYRFYLVTGGLYVYATVSADEYEAWYKRAKRKDDRFDGELAFWIRIGDQRTILTPFPPLPDSDWDLEQSPLSQGGITKLCKESVLCWRYKQRERLSGWLGRLSLRDFTRLQEMDAVQLRPYLYGLTPTFFRQAEMGAHRLEESQGCLGYGERTYRKWHCCPDCYGDEGCSEADSECQIVRGRYRLDIMRRYLSLWVSLLSGLRLTEVEWRNLDPLDGIPSLFYWDCGHRHSDFGCGNLCKLGLSKADYKALTDGKPVTKVSYPSLWLDLREKCQGLAQLEPQARQKQLGLPSLPDIGKCAMPKETAKKVIELVESDDELDQRVAHQVAETAKSILSDPFDKWQKAKLNLPSEYQPILARLKTASLQTYVLARTRFESAEEQFNREVEAILKNYREATSQEAAELWLDWRMPPPPPPELRVAA